MPEQPADPLHYEMKIPPDPKHKGAEKPPDDAASEPDGSETSTGRADTADRPSGQPKP